MNKKGQGLSITTIIVAVIAIVVLVVLIAIFTGQFARFQVGLGEAGKCSGIAADCSTFTQSAGVDCRAAGCSWDTTNSACSGTPKVCGGYLSKASCDSVGCKWQAS